MLNWLTRIGRARVATLLAAVYALCVLAPAAAFAFGDPARAAHCLTEEHSSAPVHQHSVPHQHHDEPEPAHAHPDSGDGEGGDQSQSGTCCGLVCLTALAGVAAPVLGGIFQSAPLLPLAEDHQTGLTPGPLDRPPRPRASV